MFVSACVSSSVLVASQCFFSKMGKWISSIMFILQNIEKIEHFLAYWSLYVFCLFMLRLYWIFVVHVVFFFRLPYWLILFMRGFWLCMLFWPINLCLYDDWILIQWSEGTFLLKDNKNICWCFYLVLLWFCFYIFVLSGIFSQL